MRCDKARWGRGPLRRIPSLCPVVDVQLSRHPIRVFAGAPAKGPQLRPAAEPHLDFVGVSTGIGLGVAVRPEPGRTSALLIHRGLNVRPLRALNSFSASKVIVTQDLVFSGPHEDTGQP